MNKRLRRLNAYSIGNLPAAVLHLEPQLVAGQCEYLLEIEELAVDSQTDAYGRRACGSSSCGTPARLRHASREKMQKAVERM